MSDQPPKWMKSQFTDDEHRVWESVFPPAEPHRVDENGFPVRRRRPSPLYMSKIVRSLAELGVYPVFRTRADGKIVPWDVPHDPQPSWCLDPGIRALLGNLREGSDPKCNVDAYYHPVDLAAHFGADPSLWRSWPQGMSVIRSGPGRDDVVLSTKLDDDNLDYLRRRNILQRPRATTTLVSTGGVAFFAAAAVRFWSTADERARIGRLKTKLEVDFQVIRNSAPLPEDPAIRDLITGDLPNDVVGGLQASPARPLSVPSRRELGLPEHDRQVPLPGIAPTPPANPMSPEEELHHLEARMAEVRRLIEANNIEAKRRRYETRVVECRNALKSTQISVLLDSQFPEFDPSSPDSDPATNVRLDFHILVILPDGRRYNSINTLDTLSLDGINTTPTDGAAAVVDDEADRAAFEADPVGYTFGG